MSYRVVAALAATGLLGSLVAGPAGGASVGTSAPALVPSVVEVSPAVQNDTSPSLRDITPIGPTPKSRADTSTKPRIPPSRLASLNRATQGVPDVQASGGVSLAASPSMPDATSFEGMTNPNGYYPPDTVGEIGPNHYVQMVNASFTVFARAGTTLYGPADINTVFFGFGGACQSNNDGDPIVVYDQLADRWILSQFAVPSSGADQLECVAVSATADPLGPYHRYAFNYGTIMPDYPKLGVWPDGYYATYNMFDAANRWKYLGVKVCALERRAMLVGAEASQQCFDLPVQMFSILPADVEGETPPPAGSPAYLLGEHGTDANKVTMYRFFTDWDDPSWTRLEGPVHIGVDPFTWACIDVWGCVPQPPVTDVSTPAPLAITNSALPDAVAEATYSTSFNARGGTAPYTWSVTSGSLPTGLALVGSTGVVSGTAPAAGTSASFTVTLSDSAAPTPRTASQAFTLTTRAAPALSITTSSALPDGMAGTGRWYVAQLTAAGGTAPYTWAVASGTLPADLTLSPEGRLYSTLLDEGSSTFAVQVTDSTVGTPLIDTATLTLTVKPPITAPLLDSLGANMMNRLSYRNFGDHESLLASHTVAMDGNTGYTSQTGTGWFEFRSPRKDTYRYQEGTVANPDGTTFQFMASAAMDRQGNIALGYSSSSRTLFPSINYVGRLAADPPGTMPYAEGTIAAGAGSQWGLAARWGDYTAMTVDPIDDCTFWYTNQYLTKSSRVGWTTRVASFRFPGCTGTATTPGAPAPATAVPGNATATVTWSQPSDTGGLPVAGYTVIADPGGAQCTTLVGVDANPLSCLFSGLSNGTAYTFSVTARNASGVGPAAVTAAVTPSAGSSGGGGGGSSAGGSASEPTPSPSPTPIRPPIGPGPNPGPPVLTPTIAQVPTLQTARQPAVVGPGDRVRVRALHVTPGCRVTFTLKQSVRPRRVNATGVAAVSLRAPDHAGRYRIHAVQSGIACSPLTLLTPIRVTR